LWAAKMVELWVVKKDVTRVGRKAGRLVDTKVDTRAASLVGRSVALRAVQKAYQLADSKVLHSAARTASNWAAS
jgi:hypothetical protein